MPILNYPKPPRFGFCGEIVPILDVLESDTDFFKGLKSRGDYELSDGGAIYPILNDPNPPPNAPPDGLGSGATTPILNELNPPPVDAGYTWPILNELRLPVYVYYCC